MEEGEYGATLKKIHSFQLGNKCPGKASRLKEYRPESECLKSDKTKTDMEQKSRLVKDKAHEHLSAEELEEKAKGQN